MRVGSLVHRLVRTIVLLASVGFVATACGDVNAPVLRPQMDCTDDDEGGGGNPPMTRPQVTGVVVQFDCNVPPGGGDEGEENLGGCDQEVYACEDNGGGGGTGGPLPGPPMPETDSQGESAEPDCNQPQTDLRRQAYCSGPRVLDSSYASQFTSAVARIKARGGECVAIADAAGALALLGKLRIFKQADYSDPVTGFGGAAPLRSDWATLGDEWFTKFDPKKTSAGLNLDGVIVHEVDHHLGNLQAGTTNADGHLFNADGSVNRHHTLNSKACGG